jgi:hypothetical protein
MRLSLIFGICATFLFTLHTGISLAQPGYTGYTGYTGYKSPKSGRACYQCCRRNQIKMGLPPDQVGVCVERCRIGTARNC